MVVVWRRAFVCTCLILIPVVAVAQATKHTADVPDKMELSDAVQQRIEKTLEQSSKQDVLVFNKAGSLQGTFKIDEHSAQQSLADMLKSGKSPAKECKKPVPTPPPGCVVCDSGLIVCSKKLQESNK